MSPKASPQRVVGRVQSVILLRLGVSVLDRPLLVVVLGDFASKLVEVAANIFDTRKNEQAFLDPGEQTADRG